MSTLIDEILTTFPMPAIAIDGNERIVAANTTARDLIGQGIEGRSYIAMLRQPSLVETIDAVLHDSKSRNASYLSNDGIRQTTFQVTVQAVPSLRLVVLCFADVTQLEQAGQMRRDFVANVSHELRTPLTALMGFIETLRGPARDDTAARDRFLDIMEGEAGRMNRLIGDLLSLSRVEGDERVRPRDRVNLTDILTSVLRMLRPLADEGSVILEADFQEEAVEIAGDADQLMQVFTNLVENGIKYGGSGGKIRIELHSIARDPQLRAPAIRICVIDYGPGIDDVHLRRLTERFYRADNHRSRALGGTGLGLAIVKHIVNRHRGRLRVESELGKGSQFIVVLPCDVPNS